MLVDQLFNEFKNKFKDISVGAGASSIICLDNEWIFIIDSKRHWSSNKINNIDYYNITFGCVGGTVEKNESIIDALKREIDEEIGIPVELVDSEKTYYVSTKMVISLISLEDQIKPVIIYEHLFESPEKGASMYLIFLYKSIKYQEPFPSSEIPALFTTNIDGFKNLLVEMNLEEFNKKYKLRTASEFPHHGTIKPFFTPQLLLEYFYKDLEEIFKIIKRI